MKDDGGVARSAGSWGRYMSFQHQNVCICITIGMIVIKKNHSDVGSSDMGTCQRGKEESQFESKIILACV